MANKSGVTETERNVLILFHTSKFDLVSEMYSVQNRQKRSSFLRLEVMAGETKNSNMLMSFRQISIINHRWNRTYLEEKVKN